MADLITMLSAVAGQQGEDTDPNFKQTVLLLHGDGTNGAQNNTFLDSSTNNFTITRNGNTTQGTFSPFSVGAGEWSNYFDGSGDSLSLSGSSAFSIATSTTPFTIEGWVYINAAGGCLFAEQFTGGANSVAIVVSLCDGVGVETTTGRFIGFGWYNGSAWTSAAISTTEVSLNTWTHVACVFTGSTTKIYLNGVDSTKSSSPTPATTWGVTGVNGDSWFVGRRWSAVATEFLTGYISNLRFVNGTAVYTSAFTPSTAPLTAITNTSLLTCQSNRFVDNSTNAFAITRNGDVRVTPFSPFAPTAAYDASVNGGSGYFDGSGDYLQTTSTQIIPAATTYTIEAWVYLTGSYADYREIVCQGTSGNAGRIILFVDITSGELRVQIGSTGIASGVTIVPNQWYYVAFRNNGGSYNLYVNGVSVASGTNTTTPQNTSLTIGAFSSGAEYWQGYISNVRISSTARTITVPTAPFSSDANTRLLTNFTNAGIFDQTGKNNLETVGNAQIDTTTKKYGTGSMEFDGTGDRLVIPYTNDFLDLGISGEPFTIEAWIYPTNTMALAGQIISKGGGTASWSTSSGAQYQWSIVSSALSWSFNSGGSPVTVNSGSVTLNTWQHVAVTYDGSTTRTFLNGTQQNTSASSYTAPTTRNLQYIGMTQSSGFTQDYYGFIDDLRITNGVARYTANFTPPTKAFPDQ